MKLTLGKKMYGVAGIMMGVILGISLVSFFVMRGLSSEYGRLIRDDGAQLEMGMEAQVQLGHAVHALKDYELRRDNKSDAEFKKKIEEIREQLKGWESLAGDEGEKAAVKKSLEALDSYAVTMDKLVEAAKDTKEAAALDKLFAGSDRPLTAELEEMDKLAMTNYDKAVMEIKSRGSGIAAAQVAFAVIFIAVSAFLSMIIIKNVLKSIHGIANVVQKVSGGDLSAEVPVTSNDEIGDMARGFNDMMANLKRISQQIKGMTTTLASSSEELSATTNEMSNGAKEQSRQTEQAATAITEVSQTVMDVAQNASAASDSSKEASQIAVAGREKVENTVSGMNQISETVKASAATITGLGKASQEIGNIVSTINDIADQTNLLALNAAIEAARAGEQGRGFAVVADEVRKLAERTGKATHEIGEMIRKIQYEAERSVEAMNSGISEVEKGVRLAEEAKVSMAKIVDASNRGTDMIQRIAAAAEEQSAASEQVSANMESIANVTRNTENSAFQIQAASHDLAKIATELKTLVDWFKL